MKIKPFELERYFARYEFTAPYLLSCSDCEALSMQELLNMGDDETRILWEQLKLGYTESAGHPLLRQEVSGLYTSASPEDIHVLAPEEGIFIAMNILLEKGDHVITTFPGYQSLYEIAVSLGCEVSRWEPEKEESWFFDVSHLKALIRPDTKLVVINFPHNPTGATIGEGQLGEIVSLCRQHNLFLFSDEMYRFLEYEQSQRLPSASDLYEHAVSLSGLSKSFALPGLRIGWLVSKNKALMEKIAGFKDYTTICNNAPGEILALMALRNKEKILLRNLTIIADNLKLLNAFFERYKRFFTWIRPEAGPIAFPGLTDDLDVGIFCKNLVDTKGVMLLPASVYQYPGNHFRIGFARKNMPRALAKLEEFIAESL
jgi:aspartate/methionine/tyrosine aminotransferase